MLKPQPSNQLYKYSIHCLCTVHPVSARHYRLWGLPKCMAQTLPVLGARSPSLRLGRAGQSANDQKSIRQQKIRTVKRPDPPAFVTYNLTKSIHAPLAGDGDAPPACVHTLVEHIEVRGRHSANSFSTRCSRGALETPPWF